MGLTMDMFLDHKTEENAFGKFTAAQKKEKRCLTGLARNNGGSRVSAGLQVITYGDVSGPERLAWDRQTCLERERKEKEKQEAGKLESVRLKGKVDVVHSKGPVPMKGKWNHHDQGHDSVVQKDRIHGNVQKQGGLATSLS
jgi:hypothetical protein